MSDDEQHHESKSVKDKLGSLRRQTIQKFRERGKGSEDDDYNDLVDAFTEIDANYGKVAKDLRAYFAAQEALCTTASVLSQNLLSIFDHSSPLRNVAISFRDSMDVLHQDIFQTVHGRFPVEVIEPCQKEQEKFKALKERIKERKRLHLEFGHYKTKVAELREKNATKEQKTLPDNEQKLSRAEKAFVAYNETLTKDLFYLEEHKSLALHKPLLAILELQQTVFGFLGKKVQEYNQFLDDRALIQAASREPPKAQYRHSVDHKPPPAAAEQSPTPPVVDLQSFTAQSSPSGGAPPAANPFLDQHASAANPFINKGPSTQPAGNTFGGAAHNPFTQQQQPANNRPATDNFGGLMDFSAPPQQQSRPATHNFSATPPVDYSAPVQAQSQAPRRMSAKLSNNPFLQSDSAAGRSAPTPMAAAPAPAPAPAPHPPPSPPRDCVKALYDYDANDDTELSFKTDNVIDVIQRSDSGWWQGQLNGAIGWFPSNFVE